MRCLVAVFCVFAVVSANNPRLEQDLGSFWMQYVQNVDQKDVAGLTAMYTSDAEILVPGVATIKGAAAVENFLKNSYGNGDVTDVNGTSIDSEFVHVDNHTGMAIAFQRGNDTANYDGQPFAGNYLTIFERANRTAEWKIKINCGVQQANSSARSVDDFARRVAARKFAAPTPLEQAIHAQDTKFMAAFKSQNATKAAEFYTHDAIVIGNMMPTVTGRAEVVEMFEGMMSQFESIAVTAIDIGVDIKDAFAYDRGAYTLKNKDGSVGDVGKYLSIWKKEDGAWKYFVLSFSSNKPQPSA